MALALRVGTERMETVAAGGDARRSCNVERFWSSFVARARRMTAQITLYCEIRLPSHSPCIGLIFSP